MKSSLEGVVWLFKKVGVAEADEVVEGVCEAVGIELSCC